MPSFLPRFSSARRFVPVLVAPLAAAGPAPAVSGEPALLTPIVVTGQAPDAPSEGTGQYAPAGAAVGTKDALPLIEIPQSVSVVTRQRIEDQNLVTAGDALEQVTGVTVTPWDGTSVQIRSRGYFLETSYDGVPVYSGLDQSPQYDLAMYDRIEVMRGPAGLFQGSGNPGGTVNFVRKRGLHEFAGSAAISAGSWANYHGELDLGGPLNAERTLRARFVVAGQDRDFFYERAHSRTGMVYGNLDFDLTRHTTVSVYAAHQRDRANPFAGLPAYTNDAQLDVPRSTNPMPGWASYDMDLTTVAGEVEHRFANGWSVRGRILRMDRERPLRDAFPSGGVDPATGLVDYTRRGWDGETDRTAFDVFASGPVQAFGREHRVTLGYNVERYGSQTQYGPQSRVPGISPLDPDAVPAPGIPPYERGYEDETRQSGLYGQLRVSVSDPLTVVLGGRFTDFRARNRNIAPSPRTDWTVSVRETGEFTPYAGVVYQFAPGLAAYGSYTDIFMPQTARQLGGGTLPPRVGRQVELGLKGSWHDGRLLAGAAVFRTRDVNRSMPDVENPGFSVPAGEVEVKGWEAEITGSPLAGLQLSAGYTRLMSKYLSHQSLGGTVFSLLEPAHTLKVYANYRIARTPWSVGGGAIVTSGLVGSGVAGVREQGGVAVFNAQLGYRFDERTSLTLYVDNLFDRHYYARIGGRNSYNTWGEPRSVSLVARTRF